MEYIPWVDRQLRGDNVAYKNAKYNMYFPLKYKNSIFRISIAVSNQRYGPSIYQNVILNSIVECKEKRWFLYHNYTPVNERTWFLSLAVCKLQYDTKWAYNNYWK